MLSQAVNLEGTHFACRHHSPGVWAGEGWGGRTGMAEGHKGNGWERAASCLPRDPAHVWPPYPGKDRSSWLCPRTPLPHPCTMQMKPFPSWIAAGAVSKCLEASARPIFTSISQRGEMSSTTVKRCWSLLAIVYSPLPRSCPGTFLCRYKNYVCMLRCLQSTHECYREI